MITTVFWDVGGVFSGSPFAAVDLWSSENGHDPAEVLHCLFGDYGADGDHHWHQVERGELSVREGFTAAIAMAADRGIELDPVAVLMKSANAGPTDRSFVTTLVADIAARGLRQGIITNNVKEFADGWRKIVPMEHIEVVIDSHEVALRKPDPAIFRLALDRMGVTATEAAFVDDFENNVVSSRSFCMHGICIPADEPELATNELLDMLVL